MRIENLLVEIVHSVLVGLPSRVELAQALWALSGGSLGQKIDRK